MTVWAMHWLEAEGTLRPWRDAIAAEVRRAEAAFGRVLPPPPLDVLLGVRGPEEVLPETGSGGFALGPSLLLLGFDPGNARFEAALA